MFLEEKKKVSLPKLTCSQNLEYNLHPNVARRQCRFCPQSVATFSMEAIKASAKHRSVSAPMPFQSRIDSAAAQPQSQSGVQRSPCKLEAPPPYFG